MFAGFQMLIPVFSSLPIPARNPQALEQVPVTEGGGVEGGVSNWGPAGRSFPHSHPRGSALQGEENSDVPVLPMHFPHAQESEPGLAFLPNPPSAWISGLITAFPSAAALLRFLVGNVTALLSWEHLWNIRP